MVKPALAIIHGAYAGAYRGVLRKMNGKLNGRCSIAVEPMRRRIKSIDVQFPARMRSLFNELEPFCNVRIAGFINHISLGSTKQIMLGDNVDVIVMDRDVKNIPAVLELNASVADISFSGAKWEIWIRYFSYAEDNVAKMDLLKLTTDNRSIADAFRFIESERIVRRIVLVGEFEDGFRVIEKPHITA